LTVFVRAAEGRSTSKIGVEKERILQQVSAQRISAWIDRIAQCNATPGAGCSRFSYSKEDRLAKGLLTDWFNTLGLQVTVDAVGNIRARLSGRDNDLAPVCSGSHLDTVSNGGKFDGVVGVVSAMEAVACMVDCNYVPQRPVEIMIFVEEEGSNFGMTTAGSKTLAGMYGEKELSALKNDQGMSMYEVARNFGLHPEALSACTLKSGDVKAMIEMHVEQSMVLDDAQIPIGIVQAVAGGKWYWAHFTGMANHAGATPMQMRQDPMVAAAQAICSFHELVKAKGPDSTVGTVGRIDCEPNVSNVIAKHVCFTLDIRDVDSAGIDAVANELEALFFRVAAENHVSWRLELIGESQPIRLSDKVIGVLREAVESAGLDYMMLNSGAVHDAAIMAHITDAGMIFVPSINGRSHVPDESANIDDIKLGCQVLLSAMLELSAS